MAKTSKIEREKKVAFLVKHLKTKRRELVAIIKSAKTSYDERLEAQKTLAKLPRNSSATRLRNRCTETGRANGVYRKFGLCRNKLREYLMKGYIPGGRKASW